MFHRFIDVLTSSQTILRKRMGGAASSSVFDFKYQKERSDLRKALIQSFVGDPANQDVLSRIKAVRSILIEHQELCATAAREAAYEFKHEPTSLDAAHSELDRLFTIYETNTILKSVQCRIGNTACPMGHYSPYFGDPSAHPTSVGKKKPKIKCNICDKKCQAGHNCSYCNYNMCLPCSTIYCCNGHAMKLWTHPESQHSCVVCHKMPISAGYRCTICEDYDICDLCTAKPGRKVVQQVILDRMDGYLNYMDTHQSESATAAKTLSEHRRKMATNAYPTTLDLYIFSESLHVVKDICQHEVFITRTTKEVLRLRSVLSYGAKYSATAMRESLKEGDFTAEEIRRLRILVEWSDREKSVAVRSQHVVACPLGHAAHHFTGRPLQYLRRDAELSMTMQKRTGRNVAICKVCDRVCTPEGFHCDFCEYDLCTTCSVIYCTQGHAMHMWTVPEASEVCCTLCDARNLQSGYHCNICQEDVCDWSTSREGRGDIRVVWEKEMQELVAFMKANKRLSGVAQFYNWRHANYIVSIGLLCEYVRELRTAKISAERQVAQKPIIDKIKEFRSEIAKDIAFSAMAVRETAKPEHYIFSTKKKAAAEATRLQNLLQQGYLLASAEKRSQAGIACPLGHAMSPLDSSMALQPYPPIPNPAVGMVARTVSENSAVGSTKSPISPLRELMQKDSNGKTDQDEKYASSKEMIDTVALLGSSDYTSMSIKRDGKFEQQLLERDVSISFQDRESGDESPIKTLTGRPPLSHRISSLGEGVAEEAEEVSLADGSVLTEQSLEFDTEPKTTSATARQTRSAFGQHEVVAGDMSIQTGVSSSLAGDLSLALSDVYSEDEETRLRNQRMPRLCRVCGADELHAGHFCPLCEYDLCCDCSVVYCRLGHPLKIWTFPEASTLSCDMCKKAPIHAGYRCLTCDVDVCDMCTTQDARNAFMLWPRRELKRVMSLLQELREDSEIARRYLEEQEALAPQHRLSSMSLLCKKLKEVETIKMHVDEEIRLRKLRLRAKQYGLRGMDM